MAAGPHRSRRLAALAAGPFRTTFLAASRLGAFLAAVATVTAQQQFFADAPRPPLTVATAPRAITGDLAVADVDGDGHRDIIIVDALATYAILGLGGDTFIIDPFVALPTAQRVMPVQLDGNPGSEWLLVPASAITAGPLRIERRTSTGIQSTAPLPISFGPLVASVAPSDFDRDGDIDLFVALAFGWPQPFVLLRNDGTGTFTADTTPPPTVPSGMLLRSVDYDGDGDDDVVGLTVTGAAVMLINVNSQFFPSPTLPATAIGYRDCCTGDFDGNGRTDIVFLNTNGDIDVVWCQPGFSVLAPAVAVVPNASRLLAADTDGDGDLDLVVDRSGSSISGLRNNGARSFTAQSVFPLAFTAMTAGDVDGDGVHEILYTPSLFPQRIATTRATDGGVVDAAYLLTATMPNGPGSSAFLPGDFDGDGRTDLLMSNPPVVMQSHGDRTYTSQPTTVPIGIAPRFAVDLDRDGDDDLVQCDVNWQVFTNQGAGVFTPTSFGAIDDGDVGDIDGDGNLDLVGIRSTQVFVRRRLANGTYAPPTVIQAGSAAFPSIQLADFDGDGDLDIATGLNQIGTNPLRMVFLINDGLGNFAPTTLLSANRNGIGNLTAADLDGDGDIDLVGLAGPTLRLLRNNGSGTFADVTPTPTITVSALTRISAGDVDGDGDVDLWLDRSRLLLLNQGNFVFVDGQSLLPAGSPPANPTILADVDDDGDLDIVPNPEAALPALFNHDHQLLSLGAPRLGTSGRFEIWSGPAAPAAGLAGLVWAPSQLPRPLQLPGILGKFEIDPATAILGSVVPMQSSGQTPAPITIPNVQALIGLSVMLQAVIVPSTGVPRVTNAVREVVMR